MQATLDDVRKAAREHRRTGGRRLPDDLKRQAVELLGRHRASAVAKAVGVSGRSVVESWKLRFGGDEASTEIPRPEQQAPMEFVEVPMDGLTLGGCGEGEVEVEVLGAQGHRLRLRGRLGPEALQTLVATTLGCPGGSL